MEAIKSYIKEGIYGELRTCIVFDGIDSPDPTPNDEVYARYAPLIMDDPQFDGASIDAVRAHFESWVEDQNKRDWWNKYRMCMVIDEEVLQILKNVPLADEYQRAETEEPSKYDSDGDKQWYVKLVEPWVDLPNAPAHYK